MKIKIPAELFDENVTQRIAAVVSVALQLQTDYIFVMTVNGVDIEVAPDSDPAKLVEEYQKRLEQINEARALYAREVLI